VIAKTEIKGNEYIGCLYAGRHEIKNERWERFKMFLPHIKSLVYFYDVSLYYTR
jgi:hypothetical protein